MFQIYFLSALDPSGRSQILTTLPSHVVGWEVDTPAVAADSPLPPGPLRLQHHVTSPQTACHFNHFLWPL